MPTVLVVDDDPKLVDMLRRTLTYEGYQVATATGGREALAQAEAQVPDLVVLDRLASGLAEEEVAERLRATMAARPILLLTAREPETDEAQGLYGGADDYLAKPFAPAELLARIRALLH